MKKITVFLLLLMLTFSGCAALDPIIQDINIIPISQENEISTQMAAQVAEQMVLDTNPANNQLVRRAGQKLVNQLPRKDFNYEFFVVKDDSVNAFTIPGGKIYVHTGLLKFVNNSEAELAGVLGHEIGHAYERHPVKGLTRMYGMEKLTSRFVNEETSPIKTMISNLAATGILTRYGREDEREADTIGFDLLTKAGYSPDGLLRFLEKLNQASGGSNPFPVLSTHPPTPERIARLKALINQSKTVG